MPVGQVDVKKMSLGLKAAHFGGGQPYSLICRPRQSGICE